MVALASFFCRTTPNTRAIVVLIGLISAACSSPIVVNVELVDPCNKKVLTNIAFLRFEPRGQNIDAVAFVRVEPVESARTQIPVPLAPDFHLIVTGIKESANGPVIAGGVSAEINLLEAEGTATVKVPMAPLDEFMRTTNLADADTCSTMNIARHGATATFLPAHGRVLIIGGRTDRAGAAPEYKRTIETYDPSTGLFVPVAELPFGGQRAFHTSTLLADGRVLVAGGEATVDNRVSALRSALVIDVRDLSRVEVSAVGALAEERTDHTASKLANGRVIVAGGRKLNPAAPRDYAVLNSVEVFDPERAAFFSPGGLGRMTHERVMHSAIPLRSGNAVFVAGGFNRQGVALTPEVIRLDGDALGSITTTVSLGVGPIAHASALTSDGRILLSGGYGSVADAEGQEPRGGVPTRSLAGAEVWEVGADAGSIRPTCSAQMNTARGFHTVSIVGRRAVFVGGRSVSGVTINSGEVATLVSGSQCFATLPTTQPMAKDRAHHAVATLRSGEVLILGGLTQTSTLGAATSLLEAEIFSPAREFQ